MRDFIILLVHVIVTVVRLAGPGGLRSVVAESALVVPVAKALPRLVCKEAAEILKTKRMSHQVFGVMKKMKPMRQIEVAELLVAASNFSVPYTKALLAATLPEMLVDPEKTKAVDGFSPEQVAKMQKEMEVLQRELKMIEASHGNEVLNLVLARGYLGKLLGNARIVRYLSQHHCDIFRELQAILDGASLEA